MLTLSGLTEGELKVFMRDPRHTHIVKQRLPPHLRALHKKLRKDLPQVAPGEPGGQHYLKIDCSVLFFSIPFPIFSLFQLTCLEASQVLLSLLSFISIFILLLQTYCLHVSTLSAFLLHKTFYLYLFLCFPTYSFILFTD